MSMQNFSEKIVGYFTNSGAFPYLKTDLFPLNLSQGGC